MTDFILTQERLKELIHYNPDTGIFTWMEARHCVAVGAIAGYKNTDGYIRIRIFYRKYPAHRLAFLYMDGRWPEDQMDHINHDKSDNRWVNIREASMAQNMRNRPMYKNNTSGIMGVTWYKNNQKWGASIKHEGITKYLGTFEEKWDAICARKSAEVKYGFHENHGAVA